MGKIEELIEEHDKGSFIRIDFQDDGLGINCHQVSPMHMMGAIIKLAEISGKRTGENPIDILKMSTQALILEMKMKGEEDD